MNPQKFTEGPTPPPLKHTAKGFLSAAVRAGVQRRLHNLTMPTTNMGGVTNTNPFAFLKSRDMAQRIGISSKTLARWAGAGHISRFKPNSRLALYDPADVEKYLRNANIKGNSGVSK